LCGGVCTNLQGESTLAGLWAAGETACTFLHGANRLASNSLLEAAVMSYRASLGMRDYVKRVGQEIEVPEWDSGNAADPDEEVVVSHNWQELRLTMWNYVGIVRSNKRLARAQARIHLLQEEIHEYYWNFKLTHDLIELRNLATAAGLIVRCAQRRRESRGLHYNLDYPHTDAK
ncbi:MAG: FAD-binding protein, partial [Gammaproteobacteria bacterium]|nr:FAD-binding protein [Gammaproteobacteria bacterium]